MTPVDRAAQGLLAQRQILGSAGEELQAAFESRLHRGWREQLDARGSQFNGQRQPVEPATDGGYRQRIFVSELEIWLHGPGAFQKECNGWILRKDRQRDSEIKFRQGQGRNREFMLAVDVQPRSAGYQDF
jgi:hypothetical protein